MGNFRKPLEMKILSIFATIAFADDETPHDPEAMAFCQGKPDGFYPNVKDCQPYFFCWGNGRYGDKMYCAPSTAWNDRLKVHIDKTLIKTNMSLHRQVKSHLSCSVHVQF